MKSGYFTCSFSFFYIVFRWYILTQNYNRPNIGPYDYILSFTMKITCSEWLYKIFVFNLHCFYSFLGKELNASMFVTNLFSSCIFCDGADTDAQKNSNISVAHILKVSLLNIKNMQYHYTDSLET